MADALDLTGPIADAVNGAALRGHALVLGYIDEDGNPAVSFRGSTQVHSPTQLALWARKPDAGFAAAITTRAQATLLFYEPTADTGPKYLYFQGIARVDPSINDAVYERMIEGERRQDPERHGVAVVVDVDSVNGFGAGGGFRMEREAA